MRKLAVLLIAAAAFVAGCSQSPVPQGAANVGDIPAGAIRLSGCVGGGARFDAPEDLVSTPVPPGWDGRNGLPTTVAVFAVECQHLSLGKFERGPVDFLIESHEKFQAPPNCREGDYGRLNVLTRVILSDAEVAKYVAEELGMPVSVADVTVATMGAESGTQEVAWRIDGRESSMRFATVENGKGEVDAVYRYVWPAQDRLGLVDFHWKGLQDDVDPLATVGQFSQPMLLAGVAPIVFGLGASTNSLDPYGQLRFFEGYECAREF